MPSFYPRSMPRQQLPLTPPEFIPSYAASSCSGMQYQQPYGAQPTAVHQEDNGFYAERYDQPILSSGPAPSALMYPQAPYAASSAGLPPPPPYYELAGAPMLPPMRDNKLPSAADMEMHRRSQEQLARMHKAKEEKPTGGVSSELDYEMDTMSDFVAEMSQRLIQPDHPLQMSTRKWVHSVLSATRLPSSTILLGLHYMNIRLTKLQQAGQARGYGVQMTRMITLGLLLGSKFLDDNTFINRSWAEVSGIHVRDLNEMEMEWLVDFDFRLHLDPAESSGFDCWRRHWKEWEVQAHARTSRHTKLSPIDTTVQQRHGQHPAMMKSYSAVPYHQGFAKVPTPEFTQKPQLNNFTNTPVYSPYEHAWGLPRSATDTSPASAATLTGPTTPEYFNAHNVWGPTEGYSRRTMFGFPAVSHTQMQGQQHLGFGGSCYSAPYHPGAWNNHGMNCNCFQCVRQHPPYMMAGGFGPQAVAT